MSVSAEGAHLCHCETTLNFPVQLVVMGKVSEAWNKANFTPALRSDKKEDPESYRLVNFTSILVKVIRANYPGSCFQHIQGRQVTGSNHHEFMKRNNAR